MVLFHKGAHHIEKKGKNMKRLMSKEEKIVIAGAVVWLGVVSWLFAATDIVSMLGSKLVEMAWYWQNETQWAVLGLAAGASMVIFFELRNQSEKVERMEMVKEYMETL